MNWNENMKMLEKRKRAIEIVEKIDQSLWEWYSERGREVPHWKKKEHIWWVEYLEGLDNTSKNE